MSDIEKETPKELADRLLKEHKIDQEKIIPPYDRAYARSHKNMDWTHKHYKEWLDTNR